MALKNKREIALPDWTSATLPNRWADFIEILCIYNTDHFITGDDILDMYTDEHPEEMEKGESSHSQKYDNLHRDISVYFQLIQKRAEVIGDNYPFNISEGKSISLKDYINCDHLFYIFLLCSSNCFLFPSSTFKLTHAFEEICLPILELMMPSSAETFIFGTSRNIPKDKGKYFGIIRNRLKILGKDLCTLTTAKVERDTKYNVPSGDSGIDLVSYYPIDGQPFIPLVLAQCACSYEKWIDKQYSISWDIWKDRFNELAPHGQMMFVPFFCRLANDEFEQLTDIRTVIIDRRRIFALVSKSEKIIEYFKRHSIFAFIISEMQLEDLTKAV